uniref:CCHC-type domain-containing protein n=1 Tax=Peronospora matthiolae TaxID=2874970 RepID=A0AAV1T9P9_9STRA
MASRLWLKKKFASFKHTASDMTSHVMELEQLVLKMNEAECGLSEEDMCATMLRSLPISCESLVQAFRISVTTFSFTDLVSTIIAEEIRKKDSSRFEEGKALHIGKCIDKSMPTKKNGGQRNKVSKVQCSKCGKRGHFARDCWAKPSGSDEVHEDHSDFAFNVSEDITSDCWIMDSGATAHMCKDRLFCRICRNDVGTECAERQE